MQPEFMYGAATNGDVDVISAYTSDGRIAQHDLVVLEDPRHAIPPYDAILLIAPRRANDGAMLDALRPLIESIDVNVMRQANLRATGGGGASPKEAARWLWGEVGKKPAPAR
jgi:glycine betaine/choline ABC-type transport system substrate-binding protein